MDYKLTALTIAIAAGLAVPAMAERGFGGDGARGPGMGERPSFTELDADSDGLLTVEEMQAHGQARFNGADTDGNGELTVEELNAVAVARLQDKVARRTTMMIERLDADGNGTLSLVELEAPMKSDRAAKMFSRLDRDGNGTISEEEFSAMGERGSHGGKGNWHKGQHGQGNRHN